MRTPTLLLFALAIGCKGSEPTEPTDGPVPTVVTPIPTPVDADLDGHPVDVDCNDSDASVHPMATELCDGIDNDCSGTADDGLVFEDRYVDADGDGHGELGSTPQSTCDPVVGWVTDATDCDDHSAAISPSQPEICDGIDNDCANGIDDGVLGTFSVDLDLDGYATEVLACSDPDGAGDELPGDCDDAAPEANPGAIERCDGIDNDCAGGPPEHAVPSQHATLQDAIDAASGGDTICVGAGTWATHAIVDLDLRIEGVGSEQVILDGGGTDRVLDLATGAVQVELVGLTLQNGLASDGAGLRVQDPLADVHLVDVNLVDNACLTGSCRGTGLWFTGSVTLEDVRVDANVADIDSDGLVLGVGIYGVDGTLHGERVSVDGNQGTCVGSIWIEGGGLHVQNVDTVLLDSTIDGNGLIGGQTRAPALGIHSGGSLLLERVEIRGNTSYGDTWAYPAKGALQIGTEATIRNSLIADNQADGDPAGDILGTVFTTFTSTLLVEYTTIVGNRGTASWSSLLDGNGDDVTFSHVIAHDNEGSSAFTNPSGTTTVHHSLISGSGYLGPEVTGVSTNVIDLDPGFVDPEHQDYHLLASSPAVDAGDPAVLDADGTPGDLGAFGGPNPL